MSDCLPIQKAAVNLLPFSSFMSDVHTVISGGIAIICTNDIHLTDVFISMIKLTNLSYPILVSKQPHHLYALVICSNQSSQNCRSCIPIYKYNYSIIFYSINRTIARYLQKVLQ